VTSLESLPHRTVIRAYRFSGPGKPEEEDFVKDIWTNSAGEPDYTWVALDDWEYEGPLQLSNRELAERFEQIIVISMPLESPIEVTFGTIVIGDKVAEEPPQEPKDGGPGMHAHVIIDDQMPPGMMFAGRNDFMFPRVGDQVTIQLIKADPLPQDDITRAINAQNQFRRQYLGG
jgi:hypothetical protein